MRPFFIKFYTELHSLGNIDSQQLKGQCNRVGHFFRKLDTEYFLLQIFLSQNGNGLVKRVLFANQIIRIIRNQGRTVILRRILDHFWKQFKLFDQFFFLFVK